jgi:hypothetical protein
MSRPRFSIAGLMIVVLFCAAGAAALRSSGLWAAVLFSLTLAMLGVAILGVAYRRGTRRAFWAGFALFGGGYLLACFGPWFATEVRPHLATTPLLGYLRSRIGPPEVRPGWLTQVQGLELGIYDPGWANVAAGDGLVFSGRGGVFRVASPATSQAGVRWVSLLGAGGAEHFDRIGHCLLAMLLGAAGGLVARRFHATRGEPDASTPRTG